MATEDMPDVPLPVSQPSKQDIEEPVKEPIAELAETSTNEKNRKEYSQDHEANDEEIEGLDLPDVPTSPVRKNQEEAPQKTKSKTRGNVSISAFSSQTWPVWLAPTEIETRDEYLLFFYFFLFFLSFFLHLCFLERMVP